MTLAVLALALAAPQTVVTETVVLPNVVNPSPNLGLPSWYEWTHGTPVRISGAVDFVLTVEGTWTNNTGTTQSTQFWAAYYLMPETGDCTPYAYYGTFPSFGSVAPGDTVDFGFTRIGQFNFSVNTFSTSCGVWDWTDVFLAPDFTVPTGLHVGAGPFGAFVVSPSLFRFDLSGPLTFEYVPEPLPTSSVCPGTHPGGAPLVVAGPPRSPWIFQSNAPQGISIVAVSTTASSTVPMNGLCVAEGGGRVARLTDPVDLSSGPVRGEFPPSVAGLTLFFQTWMAGAPGSAPTTGECIAVTL